MTRTFKQATNKFERSKQQKYPNIPGFLGFMVNGIETVEVPSRPGYVFVRLRGTVNEVIHAFNDEVAPVYGLPVLVTRDDIDNTRYRIISRDTGVYVNWGTTSSYLPRHGDSHSFSDRQGTGGDVVWVYGRQMMPLLVMPSGSSGGGSVYIKDGIYYQAGLWRQAGGTGTVSLIPANPSAGNARMMLIYLDENGNPGIATGTVFSEIYSGTSSIIQYLPNISNNYYVPLAGVRLTSDTTTITWGDIYDLRPWIVGDGFIPTGTFAPNSANYITLGNETGLTAERALTAGAGISITDNGANSTVVIAFTGTVSAGSSTPTYPAIYDDDTFKTTGTAIHFNNNLTVVNTGTSVWIDGQAGGSSTPTYPAVYDDNTYKATGTALHFNDNLSVIVSGTSVWIDGSASSVGGGSDILIYEENTFKATGTAIHFNNNLDVIVTGSSVWIDAVGVTGSAGTPGAPGLSASNTTLIYNDSVFKVTGTAISFNTNLSVSVTGTTAFISSAGGSTFWPNTIITPPINADFSWINQGGATITEENNGVYLYAPADATPDWRIRIKNAPSTPYTITIGFVPNLYPANYNKAGFVWRQSSDGKLVTMHLVFATTRNISSDKWSNQDTYSAGYASAQPFVNGNIYWLRATDNGVNRIVSYSNDGTNFRVLHTIGRTDFMTADQVGFGVSSENGTYDCGALLIHWKET